MGDGGASGVAERDALRLEIARLDNATVHLESSNTELQAALAEDSSDTDFREAIGVSMQLGWNPTSREGAAVPCKSPPGSAQAWSTCTRNAWTPVALRQAGWPRISPQHEQVRSLGRTGKHRCDRQVSCAGRSAAR